MYPGSEFEEVVAKRNCNDPSMCKSNRSKCYKAKLKCNSRCHGSLTCANK